MKRTGAQVGHWGKQELDGNLRKAAISSTLEAVLRGARRGNITRSLQQYHGAKMLHEMKPAIEAGAQRAVGAGYSTPGLGNAHTPGQKNFYGSLVRQQGRHRAYQLGRQHGLEVAHELGMAGKQEAIIATLQKGRDGMPGPFASQRPSTDPQKAVNFMYPTSKVLRRAPRKPVNLGAFGRAEPDGDMAKAGAFGPVLSTPEAKAKIKQVLHEAKSGKLRSWRGRNPKTGKPRRGPKVTDRRQAIAIALNSARRLGKVEEAGILEALLKRGKVEEAAGVATDVATSVLGAIHARRKTRKHADSITQVKVA
jgi:hypothetical protein